STSPSGAAATRASDRPAIHASTSAEVAEATGTEKTVPLLARTTFGLPQSVTGSAAITAAAPAASAVRRIAPRLPGFSTLSQTSTSGRGPGSSRLRPAGTAGTTASQPSGDSRYAILANTGLLTLITSAPRPATRPSIGCAASPARSGHTYRVSGRTPADRARSSSS